MSYERLRNLDADRFPHLTAVADSYQQPWSDGAFEYGLAAVLDSIERPRQTP